MSFRPEVGSEWNLRCDRCHGQPFHTHLVRIERVLETGPNPYTGRASLPTVQVSFRDERGGGMILPFNLNHFEEIP